MDELPVSLVVLYCNDLASCGYSWLLSKPMIDVHMLNEFDKIIISFEFLGNLSFFSFHYEELITIF